MSSETCRRDPKWDCCCLVVFCFAVQGFAQAVQETTEAVCTELHTKAVLVKQCQGYPVCFQKLFNCLAEAVQSYCISCFYVCRFMPVETVLEFPLLLMSVHVMFISLFWDWMSTVSLVTSLMSLACSWTHVDSLDSCCNSFYSCHGFAVQLVDSFTALILGWSCNVLCLS